MKRILVIDDDDFIRSLLVTVLTKAGYKVIDAIDGETGLKLVEINLPDLVITDYKMPGISGMDVVTEIVRLHPGIPVIMLTAYGDVSLTIKAIQAGAYDFIEKPIKNWELIEAIQNGIQASIQSKSLTSVISPESRKAIEENLLAGKTPSMREIFKNIGRISLNRVNVVISGEPGTGKEQVARLIHFSGYNRNHPFVEFNCNSDDEQMLERELFGYAKGALTGISGEKKGKLELAGEGTLFFDEITELPLNLQNKILRLLQTGKYEKPGKTEPIDVEARIIAATSKDIEALVFEGKFLNDLFYRLNMFSLHLPPLRDRREDISELVNSMLHKLNRKLNKRVVKIEDGVAEMLKKYDWPGNIRELENTLTQALILSHGDVLEKKHILYAPTDFLVSTEKKIRLVPLSEIESEHIKTVLDAVNWNKMEASSILQITRPTLNAKIEKYGLLQK